MDAAQYVYNQPHLMSKILYEYGGLTTPSAIAFKEGTQIKKDDDKIEIMCMIKKPTKPDGYGGFKWGQYKSYGYKHPKPYEYHLNNLLNQYLMYIPKIKTYEWECNGDDVWNGFEYEDSLSYDSSDDEYETQNYIDSYYDSIDYINYEPLDDSDSDEPLDDSDSD